MTTRKVICIGRNYVAHIKELNNPAPREPFFFLKPPSSILPPGASPMQLPRNVDSHHEIELGVVIGATLVDARDSTTTTTTTTPSESDSDSGPDLGSESGLESVVAGYFLAIDMTGRNVQEESKRRGLPWTTAKGFDTYLPVSNFVPASAVRDPHRLRVRLDVNGVTRQSDSTALMVYRIPKILAHVSSIMTLHPGDVSCLKLRLTSLVRCRNQLRISLL